MLVLFADKYPHGELAHFVHSAEGWLDVLTCTLIEISHPLMFFIHQSNKITSSFSLLKWETSNSVWKLGLYKLSGIDRWSCILFYMLCSVRRVDMSVEITLYRNQWPTSICSSKIFKHACIFVCTSLCVCGFSCCLSTASHLRGFKIYQI